MKITPRGKIQYALTCPHSSVDRALPSGGKNPRSSRGGGTLQELSSPSNYASRAISHLFVLKDSI